MLHVKSLLYQVSYKYLHKSKPQSISIFVYIYVSPGLCLSCAFVTTRMFCPYSAWSSLWKSANILTFVFREFIPLLPRHPSPPHPAPLPATPILPPPFSLSSLLALYFISNMLSLLGFNWAALILYNFNCLSPRPLYFIEQVDAEPCCRCDGTDVLKMWVRMYVQE